MSFFENDEYQACLVLLPDSLNRPLTKRIQLLMERADEESRLAVALRNKLHEVPEDETVEWSTNE